MIHCDHFSTLEMTRHHSVGSKALQYSVIIIIIINDHYYEDCCKQWHICNRPSFLIEKYYNLQSTMYYNCQVSHTHLSQVLCCPQADMGFGSFLKQKSFNLGISIGLSDLYFQNCHFDKCKKYCIFFFFF